MMKNCDLDYADHLVCSFESMKHTQRAANRLTWIVTPLSICTASSKRSVAKTGIVSGSRSEHVYPNLKWRTLDWSIFDEDLVFHWNWNVICIVSQCTLFSLYLWGMEFPCLKTFVAWRFSTIGVWAALLRSDGNDCVSNVQAKNPLVGTSSTTRHQAY